VTDAYTIGQLAAAAGVPTTTVRYYERRRLLRPASRAGAGSYRVYGAEELDRLRFIRAAQASGFSLEDVAMLLALRDGETEPCREVQEVIRARLSDVAARVEDLQRVERVLKTSLRMCRRHEREGRCEVIKKLSSSAATRACPTGRRRGKP
jgi:DNA-binding transcriptional MerR regulator